MRIRFCTPLLKVTTSFLFALSFFSTSAIADQAEEDATCFPLYRQTGAIPGTGIQCNIQAAAASVGLATYFCTGSPDIIERYCGTVMVPGSCPSADVGNPIDSSIGNKNKVRSIMLVRA